MKAIWKRAFVRSRYYLTEEVPDFSVSCSQ